MKSLFTSLAVVGAFACSPGAEASHGGSHPKLVDSWYHRYLGRHVDPIGLSSHVTELTRGTPVDFVEASILGSTEYYLRCGGTPEGFILGLYRDVAGVTPAPGDLKHWLITS